MSTKMFLHSSPNGASQRGTPGVHSARTLTNLRGTNVPWAPLLLDPNQGIIASPGVSLVTSTVAGPTSGVETDESVVTGGVAEWMSAPLAADATISGTITLNIWALESAMNANVAINVIIERLGSQGQVISTIAQTSRTTELGTAASVQNFTVTPTSTSMLKGDRIRVRVYGDDAGTMGSGFTFTVHIEGSSSGSDADTWVQFTENLTFQNSQPTGSKLFLTTTAGPAVGAPTELEMWTAAGSSTATSVTNTVNGPTSGVQLTDTAGGTAVEWYSRPLSAFTLSGIVMLQIFLNMSASAAATAIRAELATCDSDGSNPSIWSGAAIVDADAPGGVWSPVSSGNDIDGALFNGSPDFRIRGYFAGVDRSVTDGQRIRLRLYLDDASTGAQVSGKTATMYYNGGTADASGDTWLRLEQTVTEFVSGTASIAKVGILTRASATADISGSSKASVGAQAKSAPTADLSASARTAAGILATSGAALFAPTLTNGRAFVGIAPNAAVGTSDVTVSAITRAGVATIAAARPEPNAAASALLGAAALSGGALASWSFVAAVPIGVVSRSGGARPDVSTVSASLVGVVAQAGTGRPEPNAVARSLTGAVLAAGTARPEPSATGTASVGLVAASSPSTVIQTAALALVGLAALAQPSVVGDLTVVGIVRLGIIARAGGAVPDVQAIARAYLGAVEVSGTATPAVSAASQASIGTTVRAGAVPEPNAAARALLGAVTRSTASTDVLVTARTIAGLVARGIAVTTISAAAAARAGIATVSVPTLTTTATGRVVAGLVTYGIPLDTTVVVVLPRHWTTWSEPHVSRYREPAATTFREPRSFHWSDETRTS